MSASNVQCGNCESPLDEDRNEPHRQPCPGCGSTRRIFNHAVAETIQLGAIGLATKEAIYPTHGPRR